MRAWALLLPSQARCQIGITVPLQYGCHSFGPHNYEWVYLAETEEGPLHLLKYLHLRGGVCATVCT